MTSPFLHVLLLFHDFGSSVAQATHEPVVVVTDWSVGALKVLAVSGEEKVLGEEGVRTHHQEVGMVQKSLDGESLF